MKIFDFARACFVIFVILITSGGVGAFILNTFFPDKIAAMEWYAYPSVGILHTLAILAWIHCENFLHRRRVLIWNKNTLIIDATVPLAQNSETGLDIELGNHGNNMIGMTDDVYKKIDSEIVAVIFYLITLFILLCSVGFILGSINVREQNRFDICNTIFMSVFSLRMVLELALASLCLTAH